MKPSIKLRAFLLGSSLLAAAATATAQSIWSGASNDLWTNSGNWNTAPGSGAAVVFDGTGSNLDTTTNTAFTLNSLTFTSGQTSPVIINTTPTNSITFNPGTVLTVAAGSHQLSGTGTSGTARDLIFTGTAATDSYTFDIASGASFDIQGRIGQTGTGGSSRTYTKTGGGTLVFSVDNGGTGAWNFSGSDGFLVSEGVLRLAASRASGLSSNNFSVSSGATLELAASGAYGSNNGTLTLRGTGVGGVGALHASANTTISSGSGTGIVLAANSRIGVDADRTLTLTMLISGGFDLEKSGAGTLALNGTSTYTGATNVNNGTLLINGSTSTSSAVAVASGATLGGTGTVGGHTTVSGFLAPGNSPGTLSFGNNLTLESSATTTIELAGNLGVAGTDFDFVDVSGTLTWGGELDIISFGGYNIDQAATYNLFDASSFAGDFNSVSVGGTGLSLLADSWTGTSGLYSYEFDQTNGLLTVIPEPSAALLGGLGLLALLRRRRA